MATSNNMTKLLNKIEMRLGTDILNLPENLTKDKWGKVIDDITLETFSRYFPNRFKINISEEIIEQDEKEMEQHRIIQFLTGDKEDNIQGVYGIGEKKALIELNKLGGVTIENVIRVYKNKGISIDECLKNLILISPLYSKVIENYCYDELLNNIIGHFKYWNKKVKEIYYEAI